MDVILNYKLEKIKLSHSYLYLLLE